MGITKIMSKHFAINIQNLFIFLFLAVFPFGQIIRIGILQPLDVIAGAAAIYVIIAKLKRPTLFKYFENFLFVAFFGWLISVFIFNQVEVLYGLLYFIRILAYFYSLVYFWNFAEKSSENKELLLNSLLAVSVISSIFGWIQYFIFPSIKPFFVWGWDEHLYRLVGTFLDPTFLGIIIVFGILISINRYLEKKNKYTLLITLFLLLSLAFTYSRASYLALFAGLLIFGWYKRLLGKITILIIAFFVLMLLLPTKSNTILRFTREFSAIARIENYSQIFQIFKTSPVFGVGYDNLCLARSKTSGFIDFGSHSCSGSDSSLLFIFATTGIAGFIEFTYLIIKIIEDLRENRHVVLLASCTGALFIHSFFSNSAFYPWVIGYVLILLAVYIRERSLR